MKNLESCDIKWVDVSSDRERAVFAEGMCLAMAMIKNKSLIFMPYGTIGSFAQAIEDGDELAVWYIKKLEEDGEWPPDMEE